MKPDVHRPDSRWYTNRFVMGCVVGAAALFIYIPTWSYPFVYDDVPIVLRNPPVVGDGPWYTPWTSPYWPSTSPGDPLYRPVTLASLRLNYAVWGTDPMGYRVTAGVLHAAVAVLTSLLASAAWRRPVAGWAGGLLFAVHPVHAETLGMVVGRSELLAALLVTILLWRHLSFLQGRRSMSLVHHLVIAVVFYLALGSKEHALVAVVGVAVLDFAYRSNGKLVSWRERFGRLAASHYLGLILALTAYLAQRHLVLGWQSRLNPEMVDPFDNPLIRASLTERLLTPPALLSKATELCLLPQRLSPVWSLGGFELPTNVLRWDVVAGTVLAACLVVIGVLGIRHRWRIGWVAPCLAASLVLPCHFVPAANWLFAERWLYLPTVFLAVAVGGAAAIRPRLGLTVAVVIALLLTPVTLRYQQAWRSNDAIFSTTLQHHPRSYHALLGVASSNKQKGELARIPELIDRMMALYPDSPRAWYYHVWLLAERNRPAELLESIERYQSLNRWIPLSGELSQLRDRARLRLEGLKETATRTPDPAVAAGPGDAGDR
ncbi:MAG: hypothetical protein IID37_08615 [Planctomycetes bacterium]|nr:hypothetical protein [Planctomycetota bacterium]